MVMKLDEMATFEARKKEFETAFKEGADENKQNEAYFGMIEGMAADVMEQAKKEARAEAQDFVNASRADKDITAQEVKFFNAANTDVKWKDEELLPETTIDKIFEDLTEERPILSLLGLKTTGLRLRILKSNPEGQAVWGKIFGEIKGQLDASFTEENVTQSKLTAFVVIPNDLWDFGPTWVRRFVMLQITEVFAVALEAAYVSGDGKDKPIGLTRKVDKNVTVTGGVYPEKADTGTLTFKDAATTVKELTGVMKHLSVKENDKRIRVENKVVLVVNPTDAWDVKTQYTHLNANGVFVTALPYNITIVESEFVPVKKLIAFVQGRYDAYVGGGIAIKEFDQTLALEDCTLFTAKQFAYGKAEDDKAAAVYKLDITEVPEG